MQSDLFQNSLPMKKLFTFVFLLALYLQPFSANAQEAELAVENVTVSGTDLTFDIYVTSTGATFGLEGSGFSLSYDPASFGASPAISQGTNPDPTYGLNNGFCDFTSINHPGPGPGDLNLLFNVQSFYLSRISPSIPNPGEIVVDLNVTGVEDINAYNANVAQIDNTPLKHRLGRFTVTDYLGADDGTASMLAWDNPLVYRVNTTTWVAEPINVAATSYVNIGAQAPGIMAATPGCTPYGPTAVSGSSFVDILDGNGDLVASINPNGTDLGMVTVQVDDQAAVGQDIGNRYYLPRYFNFSSTNFDGVAATFPAVDIRLYFKDEELAAYNLAKSVSETAGDLYISHYSGLNEDCSLANNNTMPDMTSMGVVEQVTQTGNAVYDDGFYIDFQVTHFSEMGASGGAEGALPIELVSFTAKKTNETDATIIWETALEANLEAFILERSVDADNWVQVRSEAPNNTASTYTYLDANVYESGLANDLFYYRLKIVEDNGTFTYSNIQAVKFDAERVVVIKPNPTLSEAIFAFTPGTDIDNMTYDIYNAQGQMVKQGAVTNINTVVNLDLASGVYLVQFRKNDSRFSQTERLVILNR